MIKEDWTSVDAYTDKPQADLRGLSTEELLDLEHYRGVPVQFLGAEGLGRDPNCSPSRAHYVRIVSNARPMPAWALWAFVAAPVVIGILGIGLGLALGHW